MEKTHYAGIRDSNESSVITTGMNTCRQYIYFRLAEKDSAYKAIESLADYQTIYEIRTRIGSLEIGEVNLYV